MKCSNCGYENDPGEVVCIGCGWPMADDPGHADPGETE
jgi:hypothetical protein